MPVILYRTALVPPKKKKKSLKPSAHNIHRDKNLEVGPIKSELFKKVRVPTAPPYQGLQKVKVISQ